MVQEKDEDSWSSVRAGHTKTNTWSRCKEDSIHGGEIDEHFLIVSFIVCMYLFICSKIESKIIS